MTRAPAAALLATTLFFGATADAEILKLSVVNTPEDSAPERLGRQGDAASYGGEISADGRFVVFTSAATNLVAHDTNGSDDILLLDRSTGALERVSIGDGASGEAANGRSYSPRLSADGRHIVFISEASNLVPGDTNGDADVFVRDRVSGRTHRVSVASDGQQGFGRSESPSISADGRFVLFTSMASLAPSTRMLSNGPVVYVHDRETGTTSVAGQDGQGAIMRSFPGESAHMASDARFIAVAVSQPTQGIVVIDRDTGTTEPIAPLADTLLIDSAGRSPRLSRDGRFVTFASTASNLVPDDTNGTMDVFLHDRSTGTTVRASLAPDGSQLAGPSYTAGVSDDGRHVLFESDRIDPPGPDGARHRQLYMRDLWTQSTERISSTPTHAPGTGPARAAFQPLSADARWVAFTSAAPDLVGDDSNRVGDMFLRDRSTGATGRISLADAAAVHPPAAAGDSALTACCGSPVSANGRVTVFESTAWNLEPDATATTAGIYRYDEAAGTITRIDRGLDDQEANAAATQASVSGDGQRTAFASRASNLVDGDSNGVPDVFLHDASDGTLRRISVSSAGQQADAASHSPAVSGDGRVVAFISEATNLVPGDSNNRADLFLHDLASGQTRRISAGDSAVPINQPVRAFSMSKDGRRIAFTTQNSHPTALAALYLHDSATGTTRQLHGSLQGNLPPSLSGDGRVLAYATEHYPMPWNASVSYIAVVVHDIERGTGTPVNHCADGHWPFLPGGRASLSADGRFVAFESHDDCHVAGDSNRRLDTFLHDRATGRTRRLSEDRPGHQGMGSSWHVSLTPHASAAVFHGLSNAWQVDAGRASGHQNVFKVALPEIFQNAFE